MDQQSAETNQIHPLALISFKRNQTKTATTADVKHPVSDTEAELIQELLDSNTYVLCSPEQQV